MGAAYSENVSKEITNVTNNVFNSAANSCTSTATQNQSLDISGITGSSIIVDADWSQQLVLNATCLSTNSFSTNLSNQISQELEQVAKAVEQQFSLGTVAASENFTKNVINLGNTIQNVYTNQCAINSEQIQAITIQNSQAQLITADTLWTQTLNQATNCVFNNSSVIAIQNQITQDVSQSASSTVQNYLEGIVLAIAACIAAAAFLLFGFGGFATGGGKTGDQNQGTTGAVVSAAASAVGPK